MSIMCCLIYKTLRVRDNKFENVYLFNNPAVNNKLRPNEIEFCSYDIAHYATTLWTCCMSISFCVLSYMHFTAACNHTGIHIHIVAVCACH